MNEIEMIREVMSLLGRRTSERKKLSSKLNAMKPRKKRNSKPIAKAMPQALPSNPNESPS